MSPDTFVGAALAIGAVLWLVVALVRLSNRNLDATVAYLSPLDEKAETWDAAAASAFEALMTTERTPIHDELAAEVAGDLSDEWRMTNGEHA